tara:strand:+ start:767 stop:1918 length:1152 start_codon:yes stop_codon:yes gene_type:complete
LRFENNENKVKTQFLKLKSQLENEYNISFKDNNDFFNYHYSIEEATYYSDTTVSFFIYWDKIRIKHYKLDYLECLSAKANSSAINYQSDNVLFNEFEKLKAKFGNNASKWFSQLGESRFVIYTSYNGCQKYFNENKSYKVNYEAIADFNNFLEKIKFKESQIDIINQQNEDRFQLKYNEVKSKLSSKELRIFNEQLSLSPALHKSRERYRFYSNNLGNVNYYISHQIFDEGRFNSALNYAFNEHYKNNSLYNGAMPYAYCYGSNNYGASSVEVITGNSDVLVLIKNSRDIVVRHAYIKSRNSFKLRMPNGNYHVHFYYGKGWNPQKYMKQTSCGKLIGGFISNEHVTQDRQTVTLSSTQLTYTLTETTNGNFSTSPSSIEEAF